MPQAVKTRSRTGCQTCRRRHIQCDEQRPTCQRCLTGNQTCQYAPIVIPLRERRMLQKQALLPGQQVPWALTPHAMGGQKLLAANTMDPFDTLPIKMPFKSRELYHYFYQAGTAFEVVPSDLKRDCIALSTLDEHALRSTILLAGIHYCWNIGDLRGFESAFLFHKVESIRTINTGLERSDHKSFIICVRQILTIALAEACLGNLPAAEAHINGVMALFNSRAHSNSINRPENTEIDGELANRYLILTSCFLLALKSRLQSFKHYLVAHGLDPSTDESSTEALRLMSIWHGLEKGGLLARLKAMRMFPYFFSPPPPAFHVTDINALPILDSLRDITEAVDLVRRDPGGEHIDRMWNEGGPTRLMLVLVEAHVEGFNGGDRRKGERETGAGLELRTSWSGIAAATELYLHCVLGVMNAGEPMECRLLCQIVLVLKEDVMRTWGDSGAGGSMTRSLWFWKVFIGVLALSGGNRHERTTRGGAAGNSAEVCSCGMGQEELYAWFCNCARAWSADTGIMRWSTVQSVLSMICWPTTLSKDGKDHAAYTWDHVTDHAV
ncbi:hypothetical protein BJY04DRAFT_202494 [Aspergillus karnatakaensis]|uniref:Zn(II)2Cys6 transcription factor domain-containing protein n=1 Tax=Aspergillus karnatakaensis TaxID=1810916 RepID=UPI003CCCFCC9